MKRFLTIILTLCMVLSISGVSAWADNKDLGTWQTKANMLSERESLGAAVLNGKIYAIGGYENKTEVEEYDPITDTWTTKASMHTARTSMEVVSVDNKIYAIGGLDKSELSKVEEYNPRTDTWTYKTEMPTARCYFGAAEVNGRIYAIGGGNSTGGKTAVVEEYNPETNTWTTKASMPAPRSKFAIAVVNKKIYIIGGNDNNNQVTGIVEEYDPQTDTWSTKNSMPTKREYFRAAEVNGRIYAIGGFKGAGLNMVEEYDPKTDTWRTMEPMLTGRGQFGIATVNNQIFVMGGYLPYNTSKVEAFTPPETAQNYVLSVLLNINETVQLSASYNLTDNTNFTWSSTNEAVATVDANGKVTAVGEGQADIYAQNADGTFKEYIPVKVVEGTADEMRLAVYLTAGDNSNLYLDADPSKVTWTSMDESVATVSAIGEVTAVKKGLAIIKGELEGQTYQIYVRVNG
ncbi:Kelch repeat-containing protein [Anaerovorax odorimutans]|uniref:Kelch repeat-containing protein n=1 Tax=Anaerovorax odorimutans TaxID=109327 RepID=UPI00040E6A46|nr:kelch repeat-containing protein [Anaerovorax odorimutans]